MQCRAVSLAISKPRASEAQFLRPFSADTAAAVAAAANHERSDV